MTKVSPKPSSSRGIAALLPLALAKADARKIFSMVTEEWGSHAELRQLVRHDSLLELIGLSIDLAIATRPMANGIKSRAKASIARAGQLRILHEWLDQNLWRYKGQLDLCALDAYNRSGTSRSPDWVRRELSAYRSSQKKR
jgi:hypothetical protein